MLRKIFGSAVLICILFILSFGSSLAQAPEEKILEGKVVSISSQGQKEVGEQLLNYQVLEIEITKGPRQGEIIAVENLESSVILGPVPYQEFSKGDRLRISAVKTINGQVIYNIAGEIKRNGLLRLLILFIVVVLVVGRLWGALSVVGLLISFLVIFRLIIPLIIRGQDPLLAAIFGSLIIIPTTFYISHGFNKKTHVGVITTLISLTLTGFLAVYFVDAVHLTGFASEEAGFLQVQRQGTIDLKNLLLAGIIIGTLGILDDVTVGQASTVEQLKKANSKLKPRQMFVKAMRVGQDHISSMVNTLVLVYSGSALPLILMFYDSDKTFVDIIEFELIAEEIVRMLVGSIGLVLAAPLATAIAAYWFAKGEK